MSRKKIREEQYAEDEATQARIDCNNRRSARIFEMRKALEKVGVNPDVLLE